MVQLAEHPGKGRLAALVGAGDDDDRSGPVRRKSLVTTAALPGELGGQRQVEGVAAKLSLVSAELAGSRS